MSEAATKFVGEFVKLARAKYKGIAIHDACVVKHPQTDGEYVCFMVVDADSDKAKWVTILHTKWLTFDKLFSVIDNIKWDRSYES